MPIRSSHATHAWRLCSLVAALLSTPVGLTHASESVEIVRDTSGVPNVFALTDAGAMYGAGYATAQDRMYQMHRLRMGARGRIAELEGLRGPAGATTLDQDKRFRQVRFYASARAMASSIQSSDPATYALLVAYKDGVNRYIQTHDFSGDALFHNVAPELWTVADSLAVWMRAGTFVGVGAPGDEPKIRHDIEAAGSCTSYLTNNPSRIVIDEAAAQMQLSEVSPASKTAICNYAASVGFPCSPSVRRDNLMFRNSDSVPYLKASHAWAAGGTAMQGGSSTVVSMPQLPIWAPAIFHEIHVKGATFDARGLAFPGAPGLVIGSTPNIAWGVTSLSIDLSDAWLLRKSPDGLQYEYDGTYSPILSDNQTVYVRESNGTLTPNPLTVRWVSQIGPIVPNSWFNGTLPGEEYAVRTVPLADTSGHTVQALFGMMRAQSVDQFRTAAGQWRSPAAHAIVADSTGAVGYAMMAQVPVRSATSNCLVAGGAQDGWTSQTAWRDYIPGFAKPYFIRPQGGVSFSANHIAVGSWYPIPLAFGTGGHGDSNRSWRLRELLNLSTTPVFDSSSVSRMRLDTVDPVHREVARAGFQMRSNPPASAQLSAAAVTCVDAHLSAWLANGANVVLTEPKYAAAYYMDLDFRYKPTMPWKNLVAQWGNVNITHWLKDVKRRLDAFYTTGTNPAFTRDEVGFVNNALVTGCAGANALSSDPSTWAALMQANQGNETVAFQESSEGFGGLPGPTNGYTGFTAVSSSSLRSQFGASGIQSTNLAAIDSTKAVVPIGNSENPGSAHFADQADEWIASTLLPAPFSYSAVQAIWESSETIVMP